MFNAKQGKGKEGWRRHWIGRTGSYFGLHQLLWKRSKLTSLGLLFEKWRAWPIWFSWTLSIINITGAYSMNLSSAMEWKEKSAYSLFMTSSDWYQILALGMGQYLNLQIIMLFQFMAFMQVFKAYTWRKGTAIFAQLVVLCALGE